MAISFTQRISGALLASVCLLGSAIAQSDKPLKLIVPFPAGGTADVLPRILAEKMRASFPAGVVVENRAGAGGNIGAEMVYRADPDGTTLWALRCNFTSPENCAFWPWPTNSDPRRYLRYPPSPNPGCLP